MATIIKSKIEITGTSLPSDNSEITYLSYKARVEADGGKIIDETNTQNMFDWLSTNEISTNNTIASAFFGAKFIDQTLITLYSFDGNDFYPDNYNVPNYDTEFQNPKKLEDGSIGIYTRAESHQYMSFLIQNRPIKLMDEDKFVIGYVGKDSILPFSLIGVNPNTRIPVFKLSKDVSDYSFYAIMGHSSAYATSPILSAKSFGTIPATMKGLSFCYDLADKKIYAYQNEIEYIKSESSFNFIELKDIQIKTLISSDFASGGVYSPYQGVFAEIVIIRNGTKEQALALNVRQNLLY